MFKLTSQFEPTGDQPEAIKELTQGLLDEVPGQVLLGVTGSGKTFTIANVIKRFSVRHLSSATTRRWPPNYTGNSRLSSPKMRWNISYLTTTITNRKPTCPPPTRISRKIL